MSQEEFVPEQMVDMATDMAEAQVDIMSQEEKVGCIRDVVNAFEGAGLLSADPSSPTHSIEAAMQMLYICKLIPAIFPSAYKTASVEIDIQNDKESVIDSLNRSFDL